MEQEEPFRQFLSDALEKEFPQAEVHNNWDDFQDLCIQVVTVIVTVLEGILSRRNKWFQQTGLSATDIIYVLDMKKESTGEHFRTSVGSAVVNVFRQYDTRQRDVTFGIFNVDGFHQQLWESLDLVIEDILIRNEWVELELQSEWRVVSRLRSPRLPPELLRIVIHFLIQRDSRDGSRTNINDDPLVPITLSSLCRTNHEFLPICRTHLYKTIQFRDNRKMRSFFKCLAEWPHLHGLTTEIEIHSGSASDTQIYTEFFLHGQKLLPDLHALTLVVTPMLHSSLLSIRRPFHSVTTLHIRYGTFSSISDLRRLIDSFFPNLSRLDFAGAYGRFLFTHFTVPSRGPRQALSLSNLRIAWDDNNNFDALHKWLLWATPTPTTIRSLRIRSSHLEKMLPQFPRYLSIEFLNIVWYPESAEMDKRFSFGADFLPSLKTLVISAALPAHASGYCQFFSRSSPSPTLECVRIWFYVSDYDVEGQRGYSDLDATLSQLSAHVRIEIEDKHWEYLPKLKSKGVLVVPLVPYIE